MFSLLKSLGKKTAKKKKKRKNKQAYWGWETARLGSIREVSELAALQLSSSVTGTPRDQLSSQQSGKLMA